MDFKFEIDQDAVAKDIMTAINKTVIQDKLTKVIEAKASNFVSEFDKFFDDSIRRSIEWQIREIMETPEYKEVFSAKLRDSINKRTPEILEKFIERVHIRNY